MSTLVIERGDIFFADLNPVIGSEQGGIRPVVIIQNEIGNRYSPTISIVPITSCIIKAKLPLHIEVPANETNLTRDSVILAEQIRTLDKRRLKEKIGHLSNEIMNKVDTALSIQLNISSTEEKEIEEYYRYIESEPIPFIEEDSFHEFKEINSVNPINRISSNVGEYIDAFLNSDGGTIFYGITDNGIVNGIKINREQRDEIRKCINDAINIIEPKISADSISVDFKNVYNKNKEKIDETYVVEVHIDKPLDKKNIYVYKNAIHIKVNGVKNKLQGNALVDYIRKKTIKDYNL